jgi:hypothetical protein
MDKVINIYRHILSEYFAGIFANQENIDPINLNKERFKVKAIFIAVIIFLNNNRRKEVSNIISEVNDWLTYSFAQDNLFSSIIAISSQSLIKIIDAAFSDLSQFERVDVTALYETLLGIETGNENTAVDISSAKNYRNKLGGYYTPAELANKVTQQTIDTFFEVNFGIKRLSTISYHSLTEAEKDKLLIEICSVTFVDFSSGCGSFLIEVIEYFKNIFYILNVKSEKREELLRLILCNISCFDVDCIALEATKLNLLLRINQPSLYNRLNENFVHANFLLHTYYAIDESIKRDVFSSGFIYHEQLALSISCLKKYDIILGNPPWEKIRFEEKNFYALYSSGIARNYFKTSRSKEICATELSNVRLGEFSNQYKLEIEKAKAHLKNNSFYTLSNRGELNTYALFTEAAIKLKSNKGVVGLIVKSAIATSQANQKIFKHLTRENMVVAIYDFVNRKKIFNIDSRERFCFLLLGTSPNGKFHISMNLSSIDEIQKETQEIEFSYESLKLLNPFTGMLPNFTTKNEVDFLLRVSCEFPFLKNLFNEVRFGRIVHLTNHSDYISRRKTNENVAIYEGKFFNQFDGKYAGFNGVEENLKYGSKSSAVVLDETKKSLTDYFPESRFFINKEKWLQFSKNHNAKYMLAWRSLTSATNTRTCIATVLPFIPALQSIQFLTTNEHDLLYLAGLFNSVVFDFILKKKLSGIDLTQSVLNQMPVPNKEQIAMRVKLNGCIATIKEHISLLVFSLLKEDVRLNSLFENLGINNKSGIDESRFEIIRKIDLLFMSLYKLSNSELEMVLTAFSKQYSKSDLAWFKIELGKLHPNNSVSPSSSAAAAYCPV